MSGSGEPCKGRRGKGAEGEKSGHYHSVVREDPSEEVAFKLGTSGFGCLAFAF